MSSDLQTRVANRKSELIAEIIEHKKNSSRYGAGDAVDRLKSLLTELAQIVQDDVTNGWADVTPKAKARLGDWLTR